MRTLIISYSLTGNNRNLALKLAEDSPSEYLCINENKHRTTITIVFDIIFNRMPKITPSYIDFTKYDLLIFIGPIWMGHIATPFRIYFKQFKHMISNYVFISISGGALGPNPRLETELKKRLGKEPFLVIDNHIANLLPGVPKPSSKNTSAYKVTENEILYLTKKIKESLNKGIDHNLLIQQY